MRDGTALLQLADWGCMGDGLLVVTTILFLTAVSQWTGRQSNEEYCYSTFDSINSGEVPIRVMAEIL